MKRAQIDAFCGCRETLYQRIVFFAAPVILLAGIVYVAVRYAQLPAEIPFISEYGISKTWLFLNPTTSAVTCLPDMLL